LANTNLERAQLTVNLSEGLKMTAGDPHWEGSLPSETEQILEISFLLKAPPPQTVTTQVRVRVEGGGKFEKKVVRTIE